MSTQQNDPLSECVEERNAVVRLLLHTEVLTAEQVCYARRVAAKLYVQRSLCDVLIELGYVTREQIHQAVQENQEKLRLGELLNGLGYLSDEELARALKIQAREDRRFKLGEILIQHKFLSEDKLTEILALQLGLPILDLTTHDPDVQLVTRCPLDYYGQHRFIPFDVQEGAIRIAFVDPLDARCLEAAKVYFGQNIIRCMVRNSHFDDWLIKAKDNAQTGVVSEDTRHNVVDIANTIILNAVQRDASDIHVEPMVDRVRVRFRQDGVLVPFRDYPVAVCAPLTSRFKIMCGADIAEKRRHQDGRLIFNHMNVQIDLRMSFYVTVYGEQIVMRLLKNQEELLPVSEIGMLPNMLERFMLDALDAPSGVMMITGPTGSGKSTTVYSSINYLNRPEVSIITAEDPVEYKVRGIGQCSINPAIGLTFEETLKHIVRQDPDIVVVGEVRDSFSAEMCIQTALTGHKVLTTFHTEDSIGCLVRLLDMDIEPFLVSSTVSCIIAQRLMRRICQKCAMPHQPDLIQLRRLGCTYGDLLGAEFQIGKGCPACNFTGYKGRLAAFEMLIPEVYIRDAVLARKTTHELREISISKAGMITLLEDGLVKAAIGKTTVDEVLRTLPRVHKPRPVHELRRILGA